MVLRPDWEQSRAVRVPLVRRVGVCEAAGASSRKMDKDFEKCDKGRMSQG